MIDPFLIFAVFLAFIGWAGAIFLYIRKSKIDENQSTGIRDLERRLTDLLTIQMKELKEIMLTER